MKRVGIFITGSLLLSPFVVCLISDSLPLIIGGCVYLVLLLRFIPKRWKRRFLMASARYSKMFG
nr:MAG TPA: hypothetical protein [Caudoviricetes sp.]